MFVTSLLAFVLSSAAAEPYNTSLNDCPWSPSVKVVKKGDGYSVSPSAGLTIDYNARKKIWRVTDTEAHTMAVFLYGEKSIHPDSVLVSNTISHNPLRKAEYDPQTGRLKQLTDYVTYKKWLTGMVYTIDDQWNGEGLYSSKTDPLPVNAAGMYDSHFEENGGTFARNVKIVEPLNTIRSNCYTIAGKKYPLRWPTLGTPNPTVDVSVKEPVRQAPAPTIAPGSAAAATVPSLDKAPSREYKIERKGNQIVTPDGVVTIEEGSGSDDSDDSEELSPQVGK